MLKKKKADITLETIIIAVLVLVVLAILMWLAYKYIWAGGQQIGDLSKCENRANGAGCKVSCDSDTEDSFFMMGGCGTKPKENEKFCCIPKEK